LVSFLSFRVSHDKISKSMKITSWHGKGPPEFVETTFWCIDSTLMWQDFMLMDTWKV